MIQSLKIRVTMLLGAFALLCSGMAVVAVAVSPLSGDGIKMLMSDVTVEGKMNDGSSYSEFYEADGKIKAKDYVGNWTVENNSMCFVYSSNPKKMCYQIGTNASGIDWIHDGKVEGTGTVIKGNVRMY